MASSSKPQFLAVDMERTDSASSTGSIISQTPVPRTPNGHHIDPMARTYIVPEGEIDLTEAINRPPGRWTIQGTYNYGQKRPTRPSHVKSNEEKMAELAAAKAEIMRMSANLNAKKI